MRSFAALAAVALLAVIGKSGCKGTPSAPTPEPSPPSVRPNSTVLENLSYIRGLEQSSGRQSKLVFIGGAARVDGAVSPGASWRYQFAEESTGRVKLYQWDILPTGKVEFAGEVPEIIRLNITELGPFLVIDSPQAIRLAREYGAQAFVDRFPEALVGMIYTFQAREPICELIFTAEPEVRCSIRIFLHAQTGALMARDLSCYDRLPPP